ncbi:MAG: iron-sulfur cluster assembly scaffold protein [Desulfobacteraceae bacterium]|nr:iron-sulfur cluster assembly scaffold protein [Desulfobacteraceae bacterium]MBC2752254.1 iron-sulfur cluster assembly scaffold protein [Desulfobacteraceae bacterium]
MIPLLTTFAFTVLVLLIIGLAALILVRQPHRPHASSDSEVVITGTCGDTMSLRFSVAMGRIAGTSFKSTGCAYSFSCLQVAADAARGRTPLQVLDIDADFIARKVGHLPQDHQHCAKLALTTLHAAVDRYMQGRVKSESFSDPQESGLT